MSQPSRCSDLSLRDSGLDPEALLRLVAVAREAASAGAERLMHHFGHLERIREKGRAGDLVTEADEAAEAAVLAVLQRHTPEFGVLAEESGWKQGQSDLAWCVDPLDGTTNFAHGFPFFATSIGLTWQGRPLLGALAVPALQQHFWAELGSSLLVTGFAYDRHTRLDNNYAEFAYFTHRTRGVRRPGAAAVDLAFVAAGRLDGYWERGLSPWDLAAGVVLVEQAGGMVCSYDGGPIDLAEGRLIACAPGLREPLIAGLAACSPLAGSSYGAPELDQAGD